MGGCGDGRAVPCGGGDGGGGGVRAELLLSTKRPSLLSSWAAKPKSLGAERYNFAPSLQTAFAAWMVGAGSEHGEVKGVMR